MQNAQGKVSHASYFDAQTPPDPPSMASPTRDATEPDWAALGVPRCLRGKGAEVSNRELHLAAQTDDDVRVGRRRQRGAVARLDARVPGYEPGRVADDHERQRAEDEPANHYWNG